MAAPTRFWIVRAPGSEPALEPGPLGRRDVAVSPVGRDRAMRLCAWLDGLGVAAVLHSGWRRTAEPAGLLQTLDAREDPRLAPRSFGRLEGAAEAASWDRAEAPPEGESLAQVGERVGSLLDELSTQLAGEQVALFAHASTIQAAAALAMDSGFDRTAGWRVRPAAVAAVDWSAPAAGRAPALVGLDLDWRPPTASKRAPRYPGGPGAAASGRA